jgi:transcription factor IIIB subunit 2
VLTTANSLSSLLTRVSHSILARPTPSTACALLILALEAEARNSLPNLTDLAQLLAARFDIGKGVVMSQYNVIYDVVEEFIRELPWLDKYEMKKGRSKVSKRSVVARGLKDAVHFQEEIWKKKLEAFEKPKVALEVDDDRQANVSDDDAFRRPGLPPPRKKQKTRHALDAATHFLLDPLSAPLPHPQTPPQLGLPYTTYLLAASPSSLSLHAPPTRLQLLAVARGGSRDIADEELFEEGEWESMVRDDEEMERLKLLWGCDEEDDRPSEDLGAKERTKRKKIADGGKERVDMKALHRLLQGAGETLDAEDEDLKGFEDAFSFADDQCFDFNEENDVRSSTSPATNHHHIQDTRDVEELEEWRPLSPGSLGRSDVGGRYDEEW